MKSIWNKDGKLPGRNHLPGDLDTEVAVIGGLYGQRADLRDHG